MANPIQSPGRCDECFRDLDPASHHVVAFGSHDEAYCTACALDLDRDASAEAKFRGHAPGSITGKTSEQLRHEAATRWLETGDAHDPATAPPAREPAETVAALAATLSAAGWR